MASGAASLLKATAADTGETNEVSNVLQQLEGCLELIASSSLPAGLVPSGCEFE
jgi:hypothetical protein